MRPARRLATVAFAASTTLASMAASAHAILVDSSPRANGSVAAGHVPLVLKYNSKIDQARSRLMLSSPGQQDVTLRIAADAGKPSELDSEADLKPGSYVIHWQALALDGHITRGDLSFTVGPAAP
jgi:methionine-rich copper-binding protein CopC